MRRVANTPSSAPPPGWASNSSFSVDGWGQVKGVRLGYGSVPLPGPWGAERGEFRVFGIYYRDGRGLAPADNRPLAVRQADQQPIAIGTLGGHYLQLVPTGAGPFDLTVWGAWQFGDWGRQNHAALAGAAELGWQPEVLARLRPWFRAGYFRSSGDDAATDETHRTFFQILPTTRVYARFPF